MRVETNKFLKRHAASRPQDESLAEGLALIKLLAIGSREYEEGKHCSAGELIERLRKRFSTE